MRTPPVPAGRPADVVDAAAPRAGLRPTATRWSVLRSALAPTARVAHLGPATLTVVLAAVPTLVTALRGDPAGGPVVLAMLAAGAALGWAVEEPPGDLLVPLPVPSPVRTTLRVGLVAGVAVVGAALTVLVAAVGPGAPPGLRDRPAEAVAAAGVALAVGLVAVRRGGRGTGPVGVTAGIAGPPTIAALAVRWPAVLPSFATGPFHHRWWILAVVGVAVAAHAGRDPGRR